MGLSLHVLVRALADQQDPGSCSSDSEILVSDPAHAAPKALSGLGPPRQMRKSFECQFNGSVSA